MMIPEGRAVWSQVGQRVEHVELFVVFGVNHLISLQQIDIANKIYHK